VTGRDLALLPKAHLHLHFEAAVRRDTLEDLLSSVGESMPLIPTAGDFDAFAAVFLGMIRALSLPGAVRRVMLESAQDAAADGVVYLELGISPQFYAAGYGSTAASLAEFVDAAREAMARTGVEVGLMVTIDRTEPVAQAMELAQLAADNAGTVVSVGLANTEVDHPAAPFAEAFGLAKRAGLKVTPHAGELAGPAAVIEAIDVLDADRIQHGVRALEDPELLDRLASLEVCLDVCPTSNVFLGLAPSVAEHPLPRLLEAGVACTINADDPTIFGAGVLDEYRACRDQMGLSDEQLADCARTSIRFSSASEGRRRAALAGIDAWIAGS
jgi:adenosine deaminase